jgi:hypothetical protein
MLAVNLIAPPRRRGTKRTDFHSPTAFLRDKGTRQVMVQVREFFSVAFMSHCLSSVGRLFRWRLDSASAHRDYASFRFVRSLLIGLILAMPLFASGTRMVPLAIEQLAGSAELIVHARVRALSCQRDDTGRIYTRVTLDTLEVWKGRIAGGTCSVVTSGGVLGDQQVAAVGQAEYAVDDEVVLFLVRGSGDDWVTVGLEQGRFRVKRGAASQQEMVSNLFWGSRSESKPASSAASVSSPQTKSEWARQKALTLGELKRRVTEAFP